ncbi:protein ABHD11-like [Stegodyphus dumicola]|uniref:protein ABHD11-like n=1 Tax=Stegodyphus dumicola TaxID=202533 RepID=UPI0015B3370C|nr:protein ABHD11-like [Stegodyphus dumicola]
MDTMNISKAVLLGHNMGGVTAIRTALKKKERVEMLIAEDTLVRKFPQPVLDMIITQLTMAQQADEQMPSDVSEDDAKKFIFEFIYSHIPDEVKAVMKERDIDEQRRLVSLRRNPDGRYGFRSNLKVILNALKNTETLMTEPTGVYEGPACFIYGEHSPFSVKKDEQEIRQFFPKAAFEAIKDASHAVHIDCPREFTDAVLKFLSRA